MADTKSEMDINSAVSLVSTALVALANIVLVILTLRYVRLTGSMVKEMKITREPAVFVDLEFPGRYTTEFTVGNSGQSAAVNVRLQVEKDTAPWVERLKRSKLRDMAIFETGISYLPPGRTLHFQTAPFDWDEVYKGGEIVLKVIYENEAGNEFEKVVSFDVAQYTEVMFKSYRDPSHYIAEAIKRVESERRSEKRTERFRQQFVAFANEPAQKRCPACDESISENAKKCPKCLEYIGGVENNGAGSAET